jgi:hypothetical protein
MADALVRMRAKRSARLAAKLPTSRTCDGCDVCCTAPGIKEFNKPPAVPCQHLRCGAEGSCSIYAHRPKVCIDFYCLWRLTDRYLPDYMKPSLCGFMLAPNNPFAFPGVITVHVDPARPDAWRTPWAQTLFATLADTWNCIVAVGQVPITSHLFTPGGVLISIADHPSLMQEADGTVGAPSYLFGEDRRPLWQKMRETVFTWSLPPPPEATAPWPHPLEEQP